MKIILCSPRGFCAGVERAIESVEKALEKYGSPIYVRHEIVHNKWVVDNLKNRGVIFIENISEAPKDAVIIFSAHGTAKKIKLEAKNKNLSIIDAACPLVIKVHNEAKRYENSGRKIILIGHPNHPEIKGTSGQINGETIIVSSIADIDDIPENEQYAYVTQTTLSVDDTTEIIKALHKKFPDIAGADTRNICYATQNRQNTVKLLKNKIDILLVIGGENSSNSNRLRDLGEELGIKSYLIADKNFLNMDWLTNVNIIGITAGASAPEHLVEAVIQKISKNYNCTTEILQTIEENIHFNLPSILRD